MHIRGTAYEFNNARCGSPARRSGWPSARRSRHRQARRKLRPRGARPRKVTPYITRAGLPHDLPPDVPDRRRGPRAGELPDADGEHLRALAALLDVPLDEDGELRQCGIVSTFSTRNVRDLTFGGFTAYGAHGVAGATAFATPALPAPVYFNEDVIPDPTQQLLIGRRGRGLDPRPDRRLPDPRAPPGDPVRELRRHLQARPGGEREPAVGLHELGKARTRRGCPLRWSGGPRPPGFRVTKLPPRRDDRLSCAGPGCPFKRRTAKKEGRAVSTCSTTSGTRRESSAPGRRSRSS